MNLFSKRAFGYTFGIALSIAFAIALAIIVNRDVLSVLSVLVAVLASLGISAVIAALIAGYRLPVRWATWAYRAVMRKLAKRAIRSSLSHAMIPVKCLGIMPKEGTVALRIDYGETNGAKLDMWFNVHDCVNNELWGQVRIAETNEMTSLCVPSNRINEDFWEHLEERMRFDTSPPNVYLVREIPPQFLESVDELLEFLNNWR